jgi:hypothetical protein
MMRFATIRIPDIVGNDVAIGYMLVAVTLFSSLPLVIAWGGGQRTPRLFNAAMNAGVVSVAWALWPCSTGR